VLLPSGQESAAVQVSEAETETTIGFLPGSRAPQLFILNGDDLSGLSARLDAVQHALQNGGGLESVRQVLGLQPEVAARLRLVLIAADAEELAAECAAAAKGFPGALANQREWQSINGSYFTPAPLGTDAGVVLVYPGAFNSYVGMGRELLHTFPGLHEWLAGFSADPAALYQARKIFPPEAGTASDAEQQQMQEALVSSPLSMLFSGTAIAGLYTHLLQAGFGIRADAALGYSMGETAMLFATGFWTKADAVKDELAALPLFHTRLAGPLDAVREHWLAQEQAVPKGTAPFWDNHIVMTTAEKALPVIAAEPQVYLTHINAPRQLIIGGEPEACKRVLAQLKAMSFPIPYHYPMHCAAIISEYETLVHLHTLPAEREPSLMYFSSYECGPMAMDSCSIADAIAGGLCNRVDFPALVRSAYARGNRIFIEVGARGNCTKWVESILKGEPFCACSINQAEVPDLAGVLRVLARLISHGKTVNLGLLAGWGAPGETSLSEHATAVPALMV
jgi:PfaB family protein